MSNKPDYRDNVVGMAYPSEEGWTMVSNRVYGNTRADYVFERIDDDSILVLKMNGPLVTRKHLVHASWLYRAFVRVNDLSAKAKVVLVYGPLLVPPPDHPKHILIFSVAEDENKIQRSNFLNVPCN